MLGIDVLSRMTVTKPNPPPGTVVTLLNHHAPLGARPYLNE